MGFWGAGSGDVGVPHLPSPPAQCLKILLSKTLGYGIVAGAALGERGGRWGALWGGGSGGGMQPHRSHCSPIDPIAAL